MEPILIGKIRFSSEAYKKDFLRFYFYRKRFAIYEVIGLLLGVLIIFGLVEASIIATDMIDIAYIFGVVLLLLTLVEIWNFSKVKKDILTKSNLLPTKEEEIKVYKNRIQFNYEKTFISIFFSQIKKMKRLNGILYIIPKDKNEWPFKLNPEEVNSILIDDIERIIKEKIK